MNSSVICTLFENDYHKGLAALSNSLIEKGFEGTIYAGYKGSLPPWVIGSVQHLNSPEIDIFKVSPQIEIHFIKLTTKFHLSNYKPDFMLSLLDVYCPDATKVFYFDPDIVVTNTWECFEEWVLGGVALCEDGLSPYPNFHPKRVGWRKYFKKHGIDLVYKDNIYANAGFVGIKREDRGFLECWVRLIAAMGLGIGGLEKSGMSNKDTLTPNDLKSVEFFSHADQDAMNATVEAWAGDVSHIGKEAMEFEYGKSYMSHAIGHPKPWDKSYIRNSIKGIQPSRQDRQFWSHVNLVVKPYSDSHIFTSRLRINIGMMINRFYSRK